MEACSTSPAPWRRHPFRRILRFRAICCWTAWRWSSPKGAPPQRPLYSARWPRSRVPRSPWRRCSGGVGWRRGRRTWCGTSTAVSRSATRAIQIARNLGALEVLAAADNAYGQAAAFGGDFASADALIAEVDAVKEATGTRIGPYAAIALAGLRGQKSAASELIGSVITEATAGNQGTAVQYAHWANAVLMNGLGAYEEAVAAAVQASEHTPELFIASWALIELIEAATRTENAELAQGALTRLSEHTKASDSDWALGIHARSRALMSEGDGAERSYREAIDRLGRTRSGPSSHARICCTGSGCVARVAASMRASNCDGHTSCLSRSAWRRSPSVPGVSCWPQARGCANGPSRRATS